MHDTSLANGDLPFVSCRPTSLPSSTAWGFSPGHQGKIEHEVGGHFKKVGGLKPERAIPLAQPAGT